MLDWDRHYPGRMYDRPFGAIGVSIFYARLDLRLPRPAVYLYNKKKSLLKY
jgi:hypothetical protein